ncbi:hypothetical protein NT6N_24160 [Oceaniferula spumae]|uniref:CcmD family protein n=1 Tax=Oceaniferula spumae TaxID=2979115 RepID=A0AAT9FMY5_9BACT
MLLQIVGAVLLVASAVYGFSMIVGAGIGSPDGTVHDSYYKTASAWLIVSGLVFLSGWVWANVGYIIYRGRYKSIQRGKTANDLNEKYQ